jgi:hypothetical protein
MVMFASNRGGEGWICNPLIKTITDELELSRRYVERAIKRVITKGFISSKAEFRAHKQTSNTYKLNINQLHPVCEKSERVLAAIKVFVRDLMSEEKFNEWWGDLKYGWYDEKRRVFWLWVDSRKHQDKVEEHLPAINEFLKVKFGTIPRKLPKNTKRAKREVPLIRIQLVEFYLKKSD